MSIMKKSFLALALIITTTSLLPDRGSGVGAALTDAAVGTSLALAATSAGDDGYYYDDSYYGPSYRHGYNDDYNYDNSGVYVGGRYGSYGRGYLRGDHGYRRSSSPEVSSRRTTTTRRTGRG